MNDYSELCLTAAAKLFCFLCVFFCFGALWYHTIKQVITLQKHERNENNERNES